MLLSIYKSNNLNQSGERGIRTPGTLQYAGFQDRCYRPLSHLSKINNNPWAQMDSNHRSRKTADLQSAPFGRSGIRPNQILSLLSDSNQRPRDYKSRALAN